MNLDACLEEFLRVRSHRYTERSKQAHRYAAGKLSLFCRETGLMNKDGQAALSSLTIDSLERFRVWLSHQGFSDNTVLTVLRAVSRFLSWAYNASWCLCDPSTFVIPKRVLVPPKPPTRAVMERILGLPDLNTPMGVRDRLVLELLYVLGLRRGEAYRLNLDDLDLGRETVRVVGKGGDERALPLSPGIFRTVNRYLYNGRPVLAEGSQEKALLLNAGGQRFSYGVFPWIVTKYARRLDLKLTAHQLRHACATHLLEAGMPLEQVQVFLGHRVIQSTQYYTQVSSRELRREYTRTHPASSLKKRGSECD